MQTVISFLGYDVGTLHDAIPVFERKVRAIHEEKKQIYFDTDQFAANLFQIVDQDRNDVIDVQELSQMMNALDLYSDDSLLSKAQQAQGNYMSLVHSHVFY